MKFRWEQLTEKESGGNARILAVVAAALTIGIFAVYLRVGSYQFLNLDDNLYVTNNPHVVGGLTADNIRWAFTAVDYSYWHPVTWLSHMADVQVYGMSPGGHHLTSVVIHALATLMLLFLLHRLTGATLQSAFVAALFAFHPLHVESVAWIAERKDVLSALFCFLTLYLYAGFTRSGKASDYWLALVAFVLGLMSKPMLVTLPVVMLLLDYWPLDRFSALSDRGCVGSLLTLGREKIPFFACSLLSGVVTVYGQHTFGAMADLDVIPFPLRFANALVSYLQYVIKNIWPLRLAVFYPFPTTIPLWQSIGAGIILVLILAAVLLLRRRCPYLLTGWFWFLITLLPVIGLTQVGSQAMADRFAYIPGVGLFIMAAWGLAGSAKGAPGREKVIMLLMGATVAASLALSWRQVGYWRDNGTLFRHSLEITSGNLLINGNLGVALIEKGELDEAIQLLREALLIRPDFAYAHHNLGIAFAEKRDYDSALQEYAAALRLTPGDPKLHYNYGVALLEKGDVAGAIREFQTTLQTNPENMQAHYNLGRAHARKGDLTAAIREFNVVLAARPDDLNARINLGLALADGGDPDAAIRQYQEALRSNPDSKDAHNNLGVALLRKGDVEPAIREFRQVLRTRPDDVDAHSNLGAALARSGDLDAAIRQFREVLRINPQDSYARQNLERALAQKR